MKPLRHRLLEERKCLGVPWEILASIYVEKTWKQWLGPLIPDLPDFKIVINDLKPKIDQLIS